MLPALGLLILLGAAPADSSPSCAADLAGLDGKLRADYAGYLLELRGDRLQKYTAMKAALEARARRTMGDSCSFVLHDFTEWFDDPHLFVFQNPVIDSAETLRREKSVAKRHVTEASARAYYRQHETHLDPIEGIWYDRGLRVAIVPDPSKSAGQLPWCSPPTHPRGRRAAYARPSRAEPMDRTTSISRRPTTLCRICMARSTGTCCCDCRPVSGARRFPFRAPTRAHSIQSTRIARRYIKYAERAFGADTSAFVRSLVSRLEAHPGELVPLRDPAAPAEKSDPRDWVVTSGPRAVGVLIDRGTVSAAEVLVVYALQSPRATVFGEPTAGALDYESVSIVSIAPGEHRWYVGYGTITRRADLPTGGMRGTGIRPQVPIDLAKVMDPVAFVDSALAAGRRSN